jgi:hypothetical protein
MIWIIAILIGLIPALIAYKKGYPKKNEGYNFFLWWIFGASFFIIALPWAILLKSKKGEPEKRRVLEEMKKCPECTELVKKDARVCRFCGYEFYPKPITQEEEIEKFKGERELKSNRDNEEI